jgi:hypothetical protein
VLCVICLQSPVFPPDNPEYCAQCVDDVRAEAAEQIHDALRHHPAAQNIDVAVAEAEVLDGLCNGEFPGFRWCLAMHRLQQLDADYQAQNLMPSPIMRGTPPWEHPLGKAGEKVEERESEWLYRYYELIGKRAAEILITLTAQGENENDPALRAVEGELQVGRDRARRADVLGDELSRDMRLHWRSLVALCPDSATHLYDTAQRLPPPDRLVLDVTNATIADVQKIWFLVDWHQKRLRTLGVSEKRNQGERGLSPWWREWVERARNDGEQAARAQYRRECEARDGASFDWTRCSREWRRRVVQRLKDQKTA